MFPLLKKTGSVLTLVSQTSTPWIFVKLRSWSIEILITFFALKQRKYQRKFKPGPMLRRPGRPTHMNTQINCNYTPDWTGSLNQLASCYSKHLKALSFSFTFFRDLGELWKTKKKALVVSFISELRLGKYRMKKTNHNYRRCRWIELFSTVNSSTEVKSRRPAMAVYHCRCAFLWFFLLHKQKKEHKSTLVFDFPFFLPWCKKNQKNQARPEAPPAGQANAHEHSNKL